jgi:hypothetical protein
MGTAQLAFAGEQGGATGSDGSVFCACATGSCAISALVRPFDQKWRQITCPVRKYVLRSCAISALVGAFWPEVTSVTWPEMALSGSMFCACPIPPHIFFLVVVPWLPDVTEGHLIPSGFPWMCACATGSCATPVVTEGHVTPSEVSSRTSASYI